MRPNHGRNPVGVERSSFILSQGSSAAARTTLGWRTQSLRDSPEPIRRDWTDPFSLTLAGGRNPSAIPLNPFSRIGRVLLRDPKNPERILPYSPGLAGSFRTTLGQIHSGPPTPSGVAPNELDLAPITAATPLGLNDLVSFNPRVVPQLRGQPWAGGRNPFGISEFQS